MSDQPITPSEWTAFLKRLLETAPSGSSAPFVKTLAEAQALLDRLEPPDSKPGPTMSIAYLNLTVMAHNLLQSAGIHTLGDLLKHSEESLSIIPCMGRKSVKVILEALKPYGALMPNQAAVSNGRSAKHPDVGLMHP